MSYPIHRFAFIAALFAAVSLLGAGSVAGAGEASTSAGTGTEADRIEKLEAEVELLRERVDAADEAQASSDAATADGEDEPAATIDAEYVDKRIEDFELFPESRFLISGYGTVEFVDIENGRTGFGVSFNPGFHYRMSDRLHFNGELELEIDTEDRDDVDTHLGLEFAQVDLILTDSLVASGGKFLAPFNTFGQRLHANWINKLASLPPICGGHDTGGFIPVLKNIGVMASGGHALWDDSSKFNYAFYVANGATGEDISNAPSKDELLDISFNNTPDLDDGVTTGGRVGVLPIPNLVLGASYMTSDPDNARYHLIGTDAWYYYRGLELRGEAAYLTRKKSGVRGKVWGYWVQAAYRLRFLFPDRTGWNGALNRLEPVVRWGQINKLSERNRDQLAFGLNYWLFESAPLKLTYEINDDNPDDNRLVVAFAYGF